MNAFKTGGSERIILLDVMRAVAVFMMVQGHTIDALLGRNFYDAQSFLFQLWQTGRGLTAPIFLFGSGFAYVIASTRKSVEGKLPASVIYKRLRWIALLFFLGFMMHFPVASLGQIDGATSSQWQTFFQVDVLRLMAVTLLGLLALFLIFRTRKRLLIATAATSLVIAALTPVINAVDWMEIVPKFFASYLSFGTGSFFPIFPFSAYLFAGAAAAAVYLELKDRGLERRLLSGFALTAAPFVAIPIGLMALGASSSFVLGQASPFLFMYRLGIVLSLWVGVGLLLRFVKSVPEIVPVSGQHTLFIYVFHVVLVYGSSWTPGLKQVFGTTLNPYQVFIAVAAVLSISAFLAWEIHKAKVEKRHIYQYAPYAIMALFATVFVLF